MLAGTDEDVPTFMLANLVTLGAVAAGITNLTGVACSCCGASAVGG
jgi:hypothetical protein